MSADFQDLLDKYLTHTITDAERAELFRMIASGTHDATLETIMDEQFSAKVFETGADDALRDQLFEQIHRSRHQTATIHRIHFLQRSWFRYAVAILLLVTAGGAWLWTNKQAETLTPAQITQTQQRPAKEGAVLTLDDGSTLVLDSLGNGVVTNSNGTKVVLQNGQLLYEGSNTATIAHHIMTTPRARQFQLVLPDGSKVWLNCASSIRYPTVFPENDRTVEVTGEAYFEINKDAARPFIVKTREGVQVQVLGTSFNINAYADEPAIRTVLLEGQVVVQRDAERMVLKPGQQGVVSSNGGILVMPADLEEAIAWKNGQFQLSGANIPELLRQLSRWYDVEIEVEGKLSGKSFVSSISRDVPLNSILKALEMYGIRAKQENGKIIITN